MYICPFYGTLFLRCCRSGVVEYGYLIFARKMYAFTFSKAFSTFTMRWCFCWAPLFEGLFQFLGFKYCGCAGFAAVFAFACGSHNDRLHHVYCSDTFNTDEARQSSGTTQVDLKLLLKYMPTRRILSSTPCSVNSCLVHSLNYF